MMDFKKNAKLISLCIVAFVTITNCQKKKNNQSQKPLEEKLSDVQIIRFEQELFAIAPTDMEKGLPKLGDRYPDFYSIYIERVLGATANYKEYSSYANLMSDFVTNPYVRGLYDTVQTHFPDLKPIEKELKVAFKRYKTFFPDSTLPQVYSFISEFSNGAFTFENNIGIGLDMYLGEDYPYYKSEELGFPAFMIQRFKPENISINVMNVMSTSIIPELPQNANLLDHMLYYGKSLYFIKQMLPAKKEYELIHYTKENWAWCTENEVNIWQYFIERNLLFDSGMLDFLKYVQDAPSTYGMPSGAPGKVGAWIGWQIVDHYMEKNPDVTLGQLLTNTNSREILEKSSYKPKK